MLFILVSTILLSNDEVTKMFMVVRIGNICIDRTTMATIVDMTVSTC